MRTEKSPFVYQFKITLNDVVPCVWRRLQVPATYSFWDLHVALQDAMGWLDYHLHAFRVRPKHKSRTTEIGIPDDECGDDKVLPGWEVPVVEHFSQPGQSVLYEYDFGDGWEHEVLLEGILLKEKGVKYPHCLAGDGVCPPEDCGGVQGYENLLEVLRQPDHEEYESTVTWLGKRAKRYDPVAPERFDPAGVHFDDPKKRWKVAFSGR